MDTIKLTMVIYIDVITDNASMMMRFSVLQYNDEIDDSVLNCVRELYLVTTRCCVAQISIYTHYGQIRMT